MGSCAYVSVAGPAMYVAGIGYVGLRAAQRAVEGAVEEGKEIGAYLIEKGIVVGDGLIEHGKDVGAYVVEKGIDVGDGLIEHGKDVGAFVVDRGIAVADGAIEHGKEAGAYLIDSGLSVLGGGKELIENLFGVGNKSAEERLEMSKEKISDLLEQIKELKEEGKRKDTRIQQLEIMQGQLLTAQIEITRANSPLPK